MTGLLIARGDTILFEHYRYARTDKDRFLSQSMAKTLTGLLVGIAVSEGAIHSIDDAAVTYVPARLLDWLAQCTLQVEQIEQWPA